MAVEAFPRTTQKTSARLQGRTSAHDVTILF